MKNKLNKIVNETICQFINELIDPNAGGLYQPPGLDPSVVRLFEETDELYQSTLDDNYWNEIGDNFPNYNNPKSDDHKKAIDYIIQNMKKEYPEKNWSEIEKPMRKKISAGIS